METTDEVHNKWAGLSKSGLQGLLTAGFGAAFGIFLARSVGFDPDAVLLAKVLTCAAVVWGIVAVVRSDGLKGVGAAIRDYPLTWGMVATYFILAVALVTGGVGALLAFFP